MKKIRSFSAASLLVSVLFTQGSHSQDYTRVGLPEGAKARLGRGSLFEIAFLTDGRLAAATSIGIWLYDAYTGGEIALLPVEHRNNVHTAAFSPDRRTLATAENWSPTVRLWDVNSGQLKHNLEGDTGGVCSLVFSPDGKTLASGAFNSDAIRLWDVEAAN